MTFRPIDGVKVIGITGAARAGKDTLAQFILKLVPGAERFAFSDGLSAYCRATGRMQERDPRVLQDVGSAFRLNDSSVWLRVLYGAIEDRRPHLAVITGVRFPNEAEMIESMGGFVIRVVRLQPDGSEYVADDRPANHPAEREIASVPTSVTVAAESGDLAALEAFAGSVL